MEESYDEMSTAELAARVRGPDRPSSSRPKSPSNALVGAVALCSGLAVAWNVWFVLWDYLAFPGPLSRFRIGILGSCPWLLVVSFAVAGVVMWRRERVPTWVGCMSLVAVIAVMVGVVVMLTNAPMKGRFYLSVAAHGGAQPSLSWPETGAGENIDCRTGNEGSGRIFSTARGETIYYCPDGINVAALGTNRSDFEPMGGDWWVDFGDD